LKRSSGIGSAFWFVGKVSVVPRYLEQHLDGETFQLATLNLGERKRHGRHGLDKSAARLLEQERSIIVDCQHRLQSACSNVLDHQHPTVASRRLLDRSPVRTLILAAE
jgi:hypothetical protein